MSGDTVTRWCYEHDCYEHPDSDTRVCTHAPPGEDDCGFVLVHSMTALNAFAARANGLSETPPEPECNGSTGEVAP